MSNTRANMTFRIFLAISIASTGFFIYTIATSLLSGDGLGLSNIILFLIVMVAIVPTYKMYQDRQNSQPFEDELTRKRSLTAGYYSFLISLYMWIGIMAISEEVANMQRLFLYGILGMTIIYGVTNVVIRMRMDQ